MPYVPGLLSGITDDVYLSTSGALTLQDPWLRTALPNLQTAELSLNVDVVNHEKTRVRGVLRGVITPGNVRFSQTVDLEAGQSQNLALSKAQCAQLVLRNPKLWWPNGYGPRRISIVARCKYLQGGAVSDEKSFQFGIKQYSYKVKDDVFQVFINHQPIFLKGGNWGMSEYLLRARGAEYDLKARLHREMNFNMIRNWTGAVTDEEFYDACDKYGLMVWDDFWLNSHPNLPDDIPSFNQNAIEKIKRLRNHPSIAVWCGDNEGVPLPPLNENLRSYVRRYDGGDRWYQPRSNAGGLSGQRAVGQSRSGVVFHQISDDLGRYQKLGHAHRNRHGSVRQFRELSQVHAARKLVATQRNVGQAFLRAVRRQRWPRSLYGNHHALVWRIAGASKSSVARRNCSISKSTKRCSRVGSTTSAPTRRAF